MSNEFEAFVKQQKENGGYYPAKRMWDAAFAAGRALGRREERKECALLAQSFQIAHCKSHHDDAVDRTAETIKEAIIDRSSIEAMPEEAIPAITCTLGLDPHEDCRDTPCQSCTAHDETQGGECEWRPGIAGAWISACGRGAIKHPHDLQFAHCPTCGKSIRVSRGG